MHRAYVPVYSFLAWYINMRFVLHFLNVTVEHCSRNVENTTFCCLVWNTGGLIKSRNTVNNTALCSVELLMQGDEEIHEPSNSEWDIPSSEPFRILPLN
jgi:hypothetical protein